MRRREFGSVRQLAALAALSGILLVGLAVILPVAARLASTRADTG